MREIVLSETLIKELEDVYQNLQTAYEQVARALDFSCNGCPDNCCDSYFLHHTYIEWAYLWEGFKQLDVVQQHKLQERAREWLVQCAKATGAGERPQVMCPLNENGLCTLYEHRLLVCRTHGVPASLTRPDGQSMRFPGCFRCQELVVKTPTMHVERTPHLARLAMLENKLLDGRRHLLPKVRITIAEMLVKGPPVLPVLHCERFT